MNIADRLLDAVEEILKIRTDAQLAKILGISRGTIATWRHRGRVAEKPFYQKLSNYPGLNLDEIFQEQRIEIKKIKNTNKEINESIVRNIRNRETEEALRYLGEPNVRYIARPTFDADILIPYYEVPVSAGEPAEYLDEIMHQLDLTKRYHKGVFIVKVKGNSMSPVIEDGDELLVDSTIPAQAGRIVIASIHNKLTVKRVEKVNGVILLNPANPDYEPIEVTGEISILGTVIKRSQSL